MFFSNIAVRSEDGEGSSHHGNRTKYFDNDMRELSNLKSSKNFLSAAVENSTAMETKEGSQNYNQLNCEVSKTISFFLKNRPSPLT